MLNVTYMGRMASAYVGGCGSCGWIFTGVKSIWELQGPSDDDSQKEPSTYALTS